MLQTILNAFSIPDIRRKLAFTAAMLALYRLGAYIPAPGVDLAAADPLARLARAGLRPQGVKADLVRGEASHRQPFSTSIRCSTRRSIPWS